MREEASSREETEGVDDGLGGNETGPPGYALRILGRGLADDGVR
jgi:hypothetical protein